MDNFLFFFRVAIFLSVFSISACSTLSSEDDPTKHVSSDPLQSFNRGVYAFNNSLDKAILRPVAKGYDRVVPTPAKKGVGNFFSNLNEPLNFLNNLLQGKFGDAMSSTYRFTVNSTVGLFGLFDVAKAYEVEEKPEDFGQTLAAWGVKPGPYLVIPLVGPSNVRDMATAINQQFFFDRMELVSDSSRDRYILSLIDIIDRRADLLGADELLDRQIDPYAFLKTTFENHRINSIYDGDPPLVEEEDFDDF